MSFLDWVSGRVFSVVHRNNLVYNTCWEDPRLDRVALEIKPTDSILVITSAGCNALDYALAGPAEVHAVDMNPRQNALLELKKSGIRRLEYDDFFKMFGEGKLPGAKEIYRDKLRPDLSEFAQRYWDKRIRYFDHPRVSFYFRGTSGAFARAAKKYVDTALKLRPHYHALLASKSIEEQKEIYDRAIREKLWSGPLRFAMNRDSTLSLLGVPKAQRRQVEKHYDGSIVKFMQDSVETVFTKLPIADNYFWRVYMTGSYTPDCCPEYLVEENFEKLKGGLVDRVQTHTDSVQGFLEKHNRPISRFVLLDHMDWLSDRFFPLLESEWQAILNRASDDARIIWRSGGMHTDFLERVEVRVNGSSRRLPELLKHHEGLAATLHEKDRVHTYGSFYIADLTKA
ncbi:MAG TPA: BtaA family protein [Pirellulaceae bacterium]|jgi:S-adenosylmethionine-diacylglycerol 3-amino-3-carboxypropyl transferase|nr:BtaA family protein [Pirellulaceae bacterium]